MASAMQHACELGRQLYAYQSTYRHCTPCTPPAELPDSLTMGFADGGTVDNLGISALLRRGVKAMIVMSANSTPPDDTWETYAKVWARTTACMRRPCFLVTTLLCTHTMWTYGGGA